MKVGIACLNKLNASLNIVMGLIILALLFIVYVTINKNNSSTAEVGNKAPNFQLKTMDGKTVSLNDYKGKGLILNFWGTWCEPCKREMPALSKNYQEYKSKGVEVLAIHIKNDPQQVNQFFDGLKGDVNLPVAFDKDNEVTDAYGISPLPTTVVIDKDGTIKAIQKSEMNDTMIKNFMKSVQP